MRREKDILWIGTAYADLLAFPEEVRRDAGFQLGRVQAGLDPTDWKPFTAIGPGVREIRLRGSTGTFRIFYVAAFEEAVYVLHCFAKKTQATKLKDSIIARTRYRALVASRRKVR
jgi:phage-related protein